MWGSSGRREDALGVNATSMLAQGLRSSTDRSALSLSEGTGIHQPYRAGGSSYQSSAFNFQGGLPWTTGGEVVDARQDDGSIHVARTTSRVGVGGDLWGMINEGEEWDSDQLRHLQQVLQEGSEEINRYEDDDADEVKKNI